MPGCPGSARCSLREVETLMHAVPGPREGDRLDAELWRCKRLMPPGSKHCRTRWSKRRRPRPCRPLSTSTLLSMFLHRFCMGGIRKTSASPVERTGSPPGHRWSGPPLIARDATPNHREGRFAPQGRWPSLAVVRRGVPCVIRQGRRNGPRPNNETDCYPARDADVESIHWTQAIRGNSLLDRSHPRMSWQPALRPREPVAGSSSAMTVRAVHRSMVQPDILNDSGHQDGNCRSSNWTSGKLIYII